MKFLAAVVASVFCIMPVIAAPPSSQEAAPEIDMTSAVLQVVFGLGLVLFLIFILAWVLKRVTRMHATHQKMKIVSSLALGTRERAILIEVGDRQLLLGVAPGRVSLLESYPGRIIDSPERGDFAMHLKTSMQKQNVDADKQVVGQTSVDAASATVSKSNEQVDK